MSGWQALIAAGDTARVPLQRRIYQGLREAILSGQIRPGWRLPSTRTLAAELGVGRNTVIGAFEQLAAEGYLQCRVGSGTRVSTELPDTLISVNAPRHGAPGARGDDAVAPALSARGHALGATPRPTAGPELAAFQPGLPALDRFPFALWARLLARHSRRPAPATLGYNDRAGLPVLQAAIAVYLGASRGVRCAPEQVIVTGGAQAALDFAARMLLDPGDEAWIEEPGYLGARGALIAAGARPCPVAVDTEGLDADRAARHFPHARLAYVTPSYQFPTGATMSLERRLRLLDWAERAGAWVIEDDYDSEYRYRGRPLHAMQGLDGGGRVLYVGTFSKTLFPGLRLGYLVVPTPLIGPFRNALRHTGQDAALPVQAALADFIGEGHYASHVRRMRELYAARQRRFVALAGEAVGAWLRIEASDAGMQIPAPLRAPGDDRALSAHAGSIGVVAPPLSAYHLGEVREPGLYLGYAGVGDAAMDRGLDALRTACAAVLGPASG